MRNRTMIIIGAGCAALASACGDEGLNEAFSELQAAAPKVCQEYCAGMAECEYEQLGYEGDTLDELIADKTDQCVVDCGWYLNEGAAVVRYTYDEEEEDSSTKYVGIVSGGDLEAYAKCLWKTLEFSCYSEGYYGETDNESEESCLAIAQCYDHLGYEELGKWEWVEEDGGYCDDLGEADDGMSESWLDWPYFDTWLF